MYNELLTIGPFTVYGYGLMIAIGIIAAYVLASCRGKRDGMSKDRVLSLLIWCIVGGFFSAKLLYWITQFDEILKNPAFLLQTLGDGFVVFGGILGGILSGYLYCRSQKLEFLRYFDLMMPSVALAQGFGRIGCFLAGCCYGKETSSVLAVTFTRSAFAPNHVALIPTQIYSSLLDFANAGILLYLSRRLKKPGQIAACYMIFYSVGRFFLEFLRGDLERGTVGILSTSQFLAILTCAGGVCLAIWSGKRKMSGRA
jgi:phosphatidylglycerol:prolipoprotein diacylglycerol transferase